MNEPTKHKRITLVFEPTIAIMADMQIRQSGVQALRDWLEKYRPECLPDVGEGALLGLLPHDGTEARTGVPARRTLRDNEMLVELAGRKCYNSFGLKAGKKSNGEYIANTQSGKVKHASILYHAKMSFFFAGVSRRVSHEMIRNYVGADRDEEGSPSQESTRYTHHPGHFVVHPKHANDEQSLEHWADSMDAAYGRYLDYIEIQFERFRKETGEDAKGMDRKRIYEASSMYLPHSCETSWLWTTNPIALGKFIHERRDDSADAEIDRFATKYRDVAFADAPNLYQQPWMRVGDDEVQPR